MNSIVRFPHGFCPASVSTESSSLTWHDSDCCRVFSVGSMYYAVDEAQRDWSSDLAWLTPVSRLGCMGERVSTTWTACLHVRTLSVVVVVFVVVIVVITLHARCCRQEQSQDGNPSVPFSTLSLVDVSVCLSVCRRHRHRPFDSRLAKWRRLLRC